MKLPDYTTVDRLILGFDQSLRTLFGRPPETGRPNPAKGVEEMELSEEERREAGRLMRVNHCGEVCAQGLYQGQALTARAREVRDRMEESALEENDHLVWCEGRLRELESRKSYLNPLWYAGSFALGALAGLAGDKWSLGFVAETERQVEAHLDGHLRRLPRDDQRSRAILEQMKNDEVHHATRALDAGALPLPAPARWAMALTSKLMTRSTYWV